jgi:hypothetical protein
MSEYISVHDKETYRTIDEAFKKVFSSKNPRPMHGYFEPLPTFKDPEIEECKIWFPKFKKNAKRDFASATDRAFNWLSEDGMEIIECLPRETVRKIGTKKITFAKFGNEPYKFIGIFKLTEIDNDGRNLRHKRISDKCLKILNPNK